MFVKTRAVAVAVAAVGMIGFGAPLASAATVSGPGNNGGLVNVSNNQVPIQGCSNQVGVGVAGGGVPVDGAAIAAALLGSTGNAAANTDQSCHLANGQKTVSIKKGGSQAWGGSMGGKTVTASSNNGGLVNVSNNQVPVQVCNNEVAVGVLGGAADLSDVAGALGILGSTGSATTNTDKSCHLENGQKG
jgi:hypothetical protein